MNFANTSLFVGDLPKFCSETDLEQLFSPYGVLLDAKIKRNGTTGKTLSYGFVTYASETSAQEALKNMDGAMFSGRKLRVRWAMYNAKGTTSTPGSQSQLINSVYVRFVTPMLDRYITEEDLHFVFDGFGNVVDASIKESSIDHRLGRQSGYGFVHFTCDQGGIESAFKAVNAVDNANISNVVYNVELSKNLLKLFGEYQQQQQQLGAAGNTTAESTLPINSSPQKVSPASLPSPPLSLSMTGSGSSAEGMNMTGLELRYSPRVGQSLQSPSISPTPPSSHANSFVQLPQQSNNNSQYRSGTAGTHRGGPLRAASFHDLNSVRNAAAFQQQMQFQQQQQQFIGHSVVPPPQHQYFVQQSQQMSSSNSQQQQPSSAIGGGFNIPAASEGALDTLSDMDMMRMGLVARQQQQQQQQQQMFNNNNNLLFQPQTTNKLYATRSASRISSIPSHVSPQSFAGHAYGNSNNSNNNNFNLARMGGMVNFPSSPSNATVQYEYRAVTGNASGGRKFTFDGSHAETVPLDGNGSLSKFNSSDSSDRNIIIASQSSDVFRTLGVKPNSFMSNSQGSLFSLTENNIAMGVGNTTSGKSLKRGNSNMSEVSVETELDVTHLSLDQKLLTSKELDDFLFASSSASNNGNNISNNNNHAATALLGSPDHIAAPALIGSPAILRDGIASRLEEMNGSMNNNLNNGGSVKLAGMFPPPIGSPVIMDQQHRSRQNSSAGNSGNVSRISSFNLNNGNSNANNSVNVSIVGGDDLRTVGVEDSFLASNVGALSFNNHNNATNLRFSLEQMSLGSALDTNPLEFTHMG